jgi:hypothetical protein
MMAAMHGHHHDDQSRQEHPLSYKESHNEEAYDPYKTVRMIRHVMRRKLNSVVQQLMESVHRNGIATKDVQIKRQ